MKRSYHGGPISKLPRSRPKRGLKLSQILKHGPVIEVVKNGQILLPKRFQKYTQTAKNKLLSPQPGVSACATPSELPGRGGIPAKSEPAIRERRRTNQREVERELGRDRGLH